MYRNECSKLLNLILERNWDDALELFNDVNCVSEMKEACLQYKEAPVPWPGCFIYPITPFSLMIDSYRAEPFPPIELFKKVLGITSSREIQYTPPMSLHIIEPFSPAFYTILTLGEHNFISKDLTLLLLQVLIHEHPESLTWTLENGFLPIHSICSLQYIDFATIDMIKLLTHSIPESVNTENQGGLTPIKLLFDNTICNEEGTYDQSMCNKIEHEFYTKRRDDEDSEDTRHWKCILHMLCISTSHESKSEVVDSYELPLHTIVQSKALTNEILDFALKVHKRELLRKDSNGYLPLHSFIKNKNIHSQDLSMNRNDRLYKILTAYPEAAAVADDFGDYPLMTIAKICPLWSYGVLLCLEVEPDILSQRDREYNLHPFQLVSLLCDNETTDTTQYVDSLSTLYECIRARPDLVIYPYFHL